MKRSEERAIKSILTEGNLEKVRAEEGITLEYALHLYHKIGRDTEKLNELLEDYFEEELIEKLNEVIEYHREEVEILLKIKKGRLGDMAGEKNGV